VNDKKYDIIASGYVSMDRIIKIHTPAKVGFSSIIENKTCADIYYGGCSVNISHNLCRLGVVSLPVMRVGDDYEKIGFKHFLEQSGIPLDALTVIPGERTSICFLVQDDKGRHITLFYPGAMDGKFVRSLGDAIFTNARMGVMAVGSHPDNEAFLAMCIKHDLPLVFSMKGDMDAFPEKFLRELLYYCQIIFTNETEREAIEAILGESILNLFTKGRAGIIVTTLGKNGSRCYSKTNEKVSDEFIPICDTGPAVDATGSGDGYVSGFLYGYLRGKPPFECAALGSVLSSFIVENEGCCTGAPDENALNERYNWFVERFREGR
jgi:adenosine kinase